MLFASWSSGYGIQFITGLHKPMQMRLPNGEIAVEMVKVEEPFNCKFRREMGVADEDQNEEGLLIEAYAREAAYAFFEPQSIGTDGLPIRGPLRHPGVAVLDVVVDEDGQPATITEVYSGFDPKHYYGWFNTADETFYPPGLYSEELRVKVEEFLVGPKGELGSAYIKIDASTVPEPFPNYGAVEPDEVAVVVRALKLDPQRILDYEKLSTRRDQSIIAAMEALLSEDAAAAAEARALSAQRRPQTPARTRG